MLKTAAIVFGVALVLAGILGFVPGVTNDGMLLGIFHVNTAHNLVHLVSGAVALWAGFTSTAHSRTYFRVFGIIYAIVAALGFFVRDGMLLGLITNNMPDTWLHVVIALTALILGFAVRDEDERARQVA